MSCNRAERKIDMRKEKSFKNRIVICETESIFLDGVKMRYFVQTHIYMSEDLSFAEKDIWTVNAYAV